jgi:cation diffusion facilitator family transporter
MQREESFRTPSDGAVRRHRHEHVFGQDRRRPGETRTLIVIAITAAMMVVEIAAGAIFGSMALLADGLHMASHAAALGINAFAYGYARRHAHDASFSFGTGKVNTLGGFTGAVLLAGFVLVMAGESLHRLLTPVPIAFNQAIFVAVVGLLVNGASMLILGRHGHSHDHGGGEHDHGDHHHHDHNHTHDHGHDHNHDHDHGSQVAQHARPELHDRDDHLHDRDDHLHDQDHDHNLWSAYLHVLADAVTSLLAIFALLAAKYFGLVWMDPVMGIVGAILVARWSVGLLRTTSRVLLDRAAPAAVADAVRARLEGGDSRVADLHVWSIGPQLYAAAVTVVTTAPHPPSVYKERLPTDVGLVHATVEVVVER